MKLSLSTVVVDLHTGEVVGGPHGDLTDTERRLLAYLVEADGQLVPRGNLLRDVWGAHPDVKSRMVDRAVARLRKKLDDDGAPRHVLSVYGQGYRLVCDRVARPVEEAPAVVDWSLGTPSGPCVGRSDALAQLHEQALQGRQLRVCGPVGVGRYRILRELAWRQRSRFPGGVFPIDGTQDLALQIAALPVSLGAPNQAGLEVLADPDAPRLVVVRDVDRLGEAPDVPGLHVWGTTTTTGHRLAPLSDDDAVLLLRDLRRALPHAPWGPHDPALRSLVALARGLPAILCAGEALSRSLPSADLQHALTRAEPIQGLLRGVLAELDASDREAAWLLAALGPVEPDDLPPDAPLRDAAPRLIAAGLLPPGPTWGLSPLLTTALHALDPHPDQRAIAAVDLLVDAVLEAEVEAHRHHHLPRRLARLGRALLATDGLGSDLDRTALGLEAAATLLGRQHLAVSRLVDAPLTEVGRQARGRMNALLGRHDEARVDLQGPPLRPDSAAALARIVVMAGDLEKGKRILEDAAEIPGAPWLQDRRRISVARSCAYEGHWPASMAILHDVIEGCQDRGDAWTEAQALATLGHVQAGSGDVANGTANLKRAREQLLAYGDRRAARLASVIAGQLALDEWNLADAEQLFITVVQEATIDRHDEHARMGGTLLGLTCLCRDDLEGARQALARVDVDEAHAFRRVERHVRAWLLALSGQCDQAAHALTRALQSQPERPQAPARGLAHLLLAQSQHPAATVALEWVRHDVTHGDEEHAGLVTVLGDEETRHVEGTWAHLALRWRRRAASRGWSASAWALDALAAVMEEGAPRA